MTRTMQNARPKFEELPAEKQKQMLQMFRIMGLVDILLIGGALWFGIANMYVKKFDASLIGSPLQVPLMYLAGATACFGLIGCMGLFMLVDMAELKQLKKSGYSAQEITQKQQQIARRRGFQCALAFVVGIVWLISLMPVLHAAAQSMYR
ncbi:MAG: hypothetical protein GC134_06850 [Proteobacteria bacterium]|nr:hypothetical protein [Pseudomonadota bacterium]